MTNPHRHIAQAPGASHRTGISPIAVHVPDLRRDPRRKRKPYGLCVHTSGRGIVERAHRAGIDPVEFAVAYYQTAQYSAGYVIGYDGTIYQIGSDLDRYSHIGVSAEERRQYLSGEWLRPMPVRALDLWQRQWDIIADSPQHLYPGQSANGVYLGVELIPLRSRGPDWLWYTDHQHVAVADLYHDRAKVYGWPPRPRELPCPRCLGHEDVDAFGRWDKMGGWDPGAMRAQPRFSWGRVGLYLHRAALYPAHTTA